jgi:hypothetical protein
MKERFFCCRKRRQQLARSESHATIRQLLAGSFAMKESWQPALNFLWKQGWWSSVGGLLDFDLKIVDMPYYRCYSVFLRPVVVVMTEAEAEAEGLLLSRFQK